MTTLEELPRNFPSDIVTVGSGGEDLKFGGRSSSPNYDPLGE